ncbi:cytochrome P450 [Catenulispora acidiphila DSM 44928]|uniref:Cytochrome P450 n=1 Tax=Catenulispora acidiphila (strain DSM 44928 / JCM 14897 / NBRC 102108 / NRRL B-24433 / ID139908) TaxID=479433 RepID=C7Q923_CATAD|nr:cytochrome P450 [Catenulispora acidiphila]ACU72343.1 cytochrome P450 [Catenulispora acidiphila DSM 44928]
MRTDEAGLLAEPEADTEPEFHYDPFSYQVQKDPYPIYAWMRENAPVYHNPERNFYALSRYADVDAALRDPATFTNRNGISLEPALWGPQAYKNVFFLALDPPDHGTLRGLVSKDFTPRSVIQREQRIRELCRRRLDPLLESGDYVDFAADYAAAVPNDVVCEMLGVPESDWDLIRFDTDRLTKRANESDERSEETLAAAFRLATYYVHLVSEVRKHPGDNLTSLLCEAEVAGGGKLTDSEIVAFLFLLVSGGNESTGKLIGNAWYHGWRLPDVQRAGLEGRFDDWMNETLRYDSSSQMTSRTVTRDVEMHGVQVPAGVRMVMLPASANRDHRVFTDPDVFDIDRDTRKMISFGAGPHHCLGGALAKSEIRIVLEEAAAEVAEYEIDIENAKRVQSAHQRGFTTLPCRVTRRARRRETG